jgi:peroxiredoxin
MKRAGRIWLPYRLIERIGAALVAPRHALVAAEAAANADAGRAAAKTGSDAALLIGLSVVAASTREVLAALWLLAAGSVMDGLGLLVGILARAAAMDLAFLFVAGLVITILAGRKRSFGRDLDLAFVAYVPIAFVRLAAELGLALTGWPLTATAKQVVATLAYGWAGIVLVLAWRTARARALPAEEGTSEDAGGSDAGLVDAAAIPSMLGISAGDRTALVRTSVPAHVPWAGRLLVGLAIALVIVHGTRISRDLDAVRPVMTGDPAPGFHVHGIDEDGRISATEVGLEDVRGQVVLLDFWATWCRPCLTSMPVIDGLYRRHGAHGLVVLSLNMDDPAKAREQARALGLAMPLYMDEGGAARDYKVTTVPHMVLIDRQGMIRGVHRGVPDADELDAAIRALLAEPPR